MTKKEIETKVAPTVTLSQEQFDKLTSDVAVLKKSVSRAKFEENEAKEGKNKKHGVSGHCKRLQGKVIVKWIGSKDPAYKGRQEILYNGTTPSGEVLKGHFVTIDGEEIITDMIQFTRSNDLEFFTKLSDTPDGNWMIRFENPELPQEYEFNPHYNNA